MYNLIAWLTGSKSRKCDSCNRIQDRSLMLDDGLGTWFCNADCQRDDFESRIW